MPGISGGEAMVQHVKKARVVSQAHARRPSRPVARPLAGKVALVAGATRGAGRGIACMLGEAGATVYCSGRSTREHPSATGFYAGRPGTIDETAGVVARHRGGGRPGCTA